MRYLSVCSGIEAATVAWHPLGWTPVAFAEIEKFPSVLLAHYYPTVPNWGDMTKFQEWPDACVCVRSGTKRPEESDRAGVLRAHAAANKGAGSCDSYRPNGGATCAECGGAVIDLLVGGTPCQSFSVAGLRKGLADPRGNLALTYLALADKYRPEWLVWENVPGVLSSGGGWDFGAFLGGLGELGYGWAYRILDAQYFGLAQRRKRVFVVANLRGWQRAAAVLFDSASLRGHSAPRREAWQVAPALPTQRTGGGGPQGDFHYDGGLVTNERTNERTSLPPVSLCLNAGAMGRIDAESETLIPIGGSFDVAHADQAQGQVAFNRDARGDELKADDISALTASQAAAVIGMQVRRLTPRECERLQGFPDDYTLIPYRGKPAADGPRYKALGNSMAVPVMRWIGKRIQMVNEISG